MPHAPPARLRTGGLQELCLSELSLPALPSALAAAASSLTRLQLRANRSAAFAAEGPAPGLIQGLARLPLLTSLCTLEIQQCHPLPWVPWELSMLVSLTELVGGPARPCNCTLAACAHTCCGVNDSSLCSGLFVSLGG